MTFKSGDTIIVDNFAIFQLTSDMEVWNDGNAFAHARKWNRQMRGFGPSRDYHFNTRMRLLGSDAPSVVPSNESKMEELGASFQTISESV